MPSLVENKIMWEQGYSWTSGGEEWSAPWGNSTIEWIHTIFSRIHNFLPAESILEIAPGFGRWTRFLLGMCSQYIGLDISEPCIQACRKSFAAAKHARFVVNDGKSLEAVDDNSIDFAFSFDSMVHCETDILESYLFELGKKLKIGGKGFIHHSNMGEYMIDGELTTPNIHWRATSMTMLAFRDFCDRAGLKCISQEKITWGQEEFNDGFSLFARLDPSDEAFSRPTILVAEPNFLGEMHNGGIIYKLYAQNH